MSDQEIIVIPPTHEQTTPSYHVTDDLAAPFLEFLKERGITAWQPPEELEKHTGSHRIIEIEIEAGTPPGYLENLAEEFQQRRVPRA